MKPGALAPFTLALLGLLPLRAAESLPKPLMTECGRLLCGDDLSAIDAKAWRVAKGKWEIAGGALKGVELEADDHPAVIRRQLSFKDAVIQFDVRIDGCKQTTFSVNETKAHLARVLFTPAGFTAVGESASYRNLRVWEAKPNPAWESNRRRIPSSARRGGS